MAESKPSVLLLGASGALGKSVTDCFVDHISRFSRVGILTSPDRAAKFELLKSQGVDIVVGSLFEAKSYTGYDTLVSMIGNDLMAQQVEMFDAAIQAGVKHIFPSEYNSDLSQPELRSLRYFRDKIAVRDYCEGIAKKENVRFTYLETALFTEWLADDFHGFDVEKHTVTSYGTPDAEVTVTSIPDIAKYLTLSTLLPFKEEGPVRTLRVSGETLKFSKTIELLEEVQGVKYSVEYIDPAVAKKNELEAKARGDEWGEMMWSIKPLSASGFGTLVGGGVDNERFGFKAERTRETFDRVFGRK